jgi:serine/threonine protein kinase
MASSPHCASCTWPNKSSTELRVRVTKHIVLHAKNLIHRDIKPENFVIGHDDISMLYLIDFGLSKYYRDVHGKHIPYTDKKGIIGTARYASIHAHKGNNAR